MKKLHAPHILEYDRDPSGNTLVFQPNQDLEDWTEDTAFFRGEKVVVTVPAADGSRWEIPGKVVGIDDDDVPLLVFIKISWGQAALLLDEPSS